MENITVEKCFEELNQVLTKLEDENTGLEESFKLYEEGMKLVNAARAGIDKVEKDLRILTETKESL